MPYSKLFYHLITGTKNRLPIILPSFEKDLYRVICSKVVDLGGIVHAIGGTNDHLHLAFSTPPKQLLTKLIGEVKGTSSHFVNQVIKPGHDFYWQAEYGILTFSEKQLPVVIRYLQNQKIHHSEGNIIREMEML